MIKNKEPKNVLDKTRQIPGGRKVAYSARKVGEILGISRTSVGNGVKSGALQPQMITKDEPDDKPAYSFHPDYVKEILKLMPKNLKKNAEIFTPSLKERLKPINEKWEKRYPVDPLDRFFIVWPPKKDK